MNPVNQSIIFSKMVFVIIMSLLHIDVSNFLPRLGRLICAALVFRWVLACRDSLAISRGLCEEVTVVAHSTGAPVAALVAELFDVDRLIFTGPNFVSQAGDRW